MELKDLYTAIELLKQRQFEYSLNSQNKIDTNILEWNKKKKIWEYYFLDERGGKHNFKTFLSEEACRYVLSDAIKNDKIFHDSWLDAVKRKFG